MMPRMIVRGGRIPAFDFQGLRISDYTADRDELSSSLARIEVAVGAHHAPSRSTRSDKYYYLLSGRLRIETEHEGEDELEAGDAWIVPRGELFRYANTADGPATLLLVHTPSFRLEAETFEPET
jgi:mannose-6-phosphate isomerase-like protein (cupin superfamily)